MNLARIKLMTLLLKSPVKSQTVNLVRLANAMPPTDSHDSSAISLTGYWNDAHLGTIDNGDVIDNVKKIE